MRVPKLVLHWCYLHAMHFIAQVGSSFFCAIVQSVKIKKPKLFWLKHNNRYSETVFPFGWGVRMRFYISPNCRFDLWLNARISTLFWFSEGDALRFADHSSRTHTYIRIWIAFYHTFRSLTHTYSGSFTIHSYDLELWLLFGFANDSIFYGRNE